MKRILALLFALTLPALGLAQAGAVSYPVYENTYVNDYANAIEDGAEGRITTALRTLREETGIEATVLTLYTRWGSGSGTLEEFATALFNNWGIGDAQRNDGILVLVVTEDREMRIELGTGYGHSFDREAQDIIDRVFIPAFKQGDFSTGIEDGTGAVIERIARVQAAGEAPPARDVNAGTGALLAWIVGMATIAVFGATLFGRRISDRFRKCPQCGERGMHTERNILQSATRAATGLGERTVTCPHCGYSATNQYTIPRISRASSSSSGGSFGGGSSSGGGASGRW